MTLPQVCCSMAYVPTHPHWDYPISTYFFCDSDLHIILAVCACGILISSQTGTQKSPRQAWIWLNMAPNTTLTLTTHNSNVSKQLLLPTPIPRNQRGRVTYLLHITRIYTHIFQVWVPNVANIEMRYLSSHSHTPWDPMSFPGRHAFTLRCQCLKSPPARVYAKRASPTWQNAGAGNIEIYINW